MKWFSNFPEKYTGYTKGCTRLSFKIALSYNWDLVTPRWAHPILWEPMSLIVLKFDRSITSYKK